MSPFVPDWVRSDPSWEGVSEFLSGLLSADRQPRRPTASGWHAHHVYELNEFNEESPHRALTHRKPTEARGVTRTPAGA